MEPFIPGFRPGDEWLGISGDSRLMGHMMNGWCWIVYFENFFLVFKVSPLYGKVCWKGKEESTEKREVFDRRL